MNVHGKIGPQYAKVQEISVHTDTRDVLAHAGPGVVADQRDDDDDRERPECQCLELALTHAPAVLEPVADAEDALDRVGEHRDPRPERDPAGDEDRRDPDGRRRPPIRRRDRVEDRRSAAARQHLSAADRPARRGRLLAVVRVVAGAPPVVV